MAPTTISRRPADFYDPRSRLARRDANACSDSGFGRPKLARAGSLGRTSRRLPADWPNLLDTSSPREKANERVRASRIDAIPRSPDASSCRVSLLALRLQRSRVRDRAGSLRRSRIGMLRAIEPGPALRFVHRNVITRDARRE